MSHYEERLDQDLHRIRELVDSLCFAVESQVRDSVKALVEFDHDLANQVILGDRAINRKVRELDRLCHAFVVRHLPTAGHLRFVSSVLRVDVALERIGDYASGIARQTIRLSEPPTKKITKDTTILAQTSRSTLADALKAFRDGNAELARNTFGDAEQTDSTFDRAVHDLVVVGEKDKRPLLDIFGMVQILTLIKRVAEQAENVCVETVFAVEGQTRDPKTYRVLFVDEHNRCRSLIAEAYARKAFPNSGRYASAGWDPASKVDPQLVSFLDGHGMDARGFEPALLPSLEDVSPHYHVVVALGKGTRAKIDPLPFRTVLLEWDIEACPKDTGEAADETLSRIYREISSKVRDLMETLRGPDAD